MDEKIDRAKLVDHLYAAAELFVDEYNAKNEAQVAVDVDGDEITIDGGYRGLFKISVIEDTD